jgi:hypothetical protein
MPQMIFILESGSDAIVENNSSGVTSYGYGDS